MSNVRAPDRPTDPIVLNPEFIDRLRCPVTRSRLRPMTADELAELNTRAARGDVRLRGGARIERALAAALTTVDGRFAYVVEDDIFCILPDMAISLRRDEAPTAAIDPAKQKVKDFYERIGWEQNEEGQFEDALKFEDLRPVSSEYLHRCHLRLNRYIKPSRDGFLLDVASGPVQYPEYLTYSEGFRYRICADISAAALRAAKKKLGRRAFYLLADVTNLPLADEAVEGVISLHTIYHVPKTEQERAFLEMQRVVRRGGAVVVVYAWNSPVMRFALLPLLGPRLAWRVGRKLLPKSHSEPLFFHAYPYSWFKRRDWFRSSDVFVWRSVDVLFMRVYIHRALFGKQILRGLYALEERFPRLAARLGAYPVFVFSK